MAGTHDVVDEANFSRSLEARKQPTLDELDRYAQTAPEAEPAARGYNQGLSRLWYNEDCLAALASTEVKRLLCLTAVRANRPFLIDILGQQIVEDKAFLDYVKPFFPCEVSALLSASHSTPGAFKGICLVDPGIMQAWLTIGPLNTCKRSTLIFRTSSTTSTHFTSLYRDIMDSTTMRREQR